jgi:hypothetical protein
MTVLSLYYYFNSILCESVKEGNDSQNLENDKKSLISVVAALGLISLSSFLILRAAGCAKFRATQIPIKLEKSQSVNQVVRNVENVRSSAENSLVGQRDSLSRTQYAGVAGVYEVSKKCQRVFDATIDNICKNIGIPVPEGLSEKRDLTKKYIHVLALTETDKEVREAVKFLIENSQQEYDYEFIQAFIGRIKKIEDPEKIYGEIVRRTRGPGELRFHATNELALSSIQEHGLSFEHRNYDRETFLKVIDIAAKADLWLFSCAKRDVREKTVCTSTAFEHCLSAYASRNMPEWLDHFAEMLFRPDWNPSRDPEVILRKLRETLETKRSVLSQDEIDLFIQFISTNLNPYKNIDVLKRVFIVCKKDPIQEVSEDRNFLWRDYKVKVMSKYGDINEKLTQASLAEQDCSFLKPENLDFFIRSPRD